MVVEAHPQLEVEGGADHGLRHCLAVPAGQRYDRHNKNIVS